MPSPESGGGRKDAAEAFNHEQAARRAKSEALGQVAERSRAAAENARALGGEFAEGAEYGAEANAEDAKKKQRLIELQKELINLEGEKATLKANNEDTSFQDDEIEDVKRDLEAIKESLGNQRQAA